MTSHNAHRHAARIATVPAAMLPVLMVASPGLAATGGWRGTGLTSLQYLGIFVGAPIGLFLIIALLFVLLPSWVGQSRYRTGPGLIRAPEPVWFDGPDDGRGSLQVAEPSQDGGGASASW